MDLLEKIPLLPCLAADLATRMQLSGSQSPGSSLEVTPNSLLHWITAQVPDPHVHSLVRIP